MSVTGSGGKTTAIEHLARYWEKQGHRVLVTTTTKMVHPDSHDYPFLSRQLQSQAFQQEAEPICGATVLYGVSAGNKMLPVGSDLLRRSIERFDRVLIEADGARGLPLKIHSERDPVIVEETTAVLAVMGLQAWGKRLDERTLYLSSRYRMLTEDASERVDFNTYRRLLEHPEGVFKRGGNRHIVLCCNQSDEVDDAVCEQLMKELGRGWVGRSYWLLCCSLHAGSIVAYREVKGEGGSAGELV